MTREEAKTHLIAMKAKFEMLLSMRGLEVSDVFDVAIEALSAEPCGDAVSRQAVIDTTICDGIACNECSFHTLENWTHVCLLRERVMKLPPVTPKVSECEDAISRKAVIEITAETGALETQGRVKALPPVTPKVAECADAISRQALREWMEDKTFGDIVVASEHNFDCLPPVIPKVSECEDCISRAELLKAIDTWDRFGVDDTNSLFRLDNLSLPHYVPYMHYDDVIKCIKGMPPVTPKQKWIPVSERLPEPYGQVLRTVKSIGWNGTFSIYVDIGTVCPIDTDVIAWMPIPVPYKAESEE